VSLVPLLKLEQDLRVKACYLEAMRLNGIVVQEHLAKIEDYDPSRHTDNYELGQWRQGKPGRPDNLQMEVHSVRAPCEAVVVMLQAYGAYLVEPWMDRADQLYRTYLKETCQYLLGTYEYGKMRTFAMLYAEMAYWLAVQLGMFAYESTGTAG
jgi:hypothetical protein